MTRILLFFFSLFFLPTQRHLWKGQNQSSTPASLQTLHQFRPYLESDSYWLLQLYLSKGGISSKLSVVTYRLWNIRYSIVSSILSHVLKCVHYDYVPRSVLPPGILFHILPFHHQRPNPLKQPPSYNHLQFRQHNLPRPQFSAQAFDLYQISKPLLPSEVSTSKSHRSTGATSIVYSSSQG